MAASVGTLAHLGIDTSNPVGKAFAFVNENLIAQSQPIDASGVRGTRQHFIDRVRGGPIHIAGNINMQPNAVETSLLLQWILGGTPTGSPTVTYPLADALQTRYVTIDRTLKVDTYAANMVDVATWTSSPGEPLGLDLSLVGTTETVGNAASFPAGLYIDTANGPFVMSDLAIVLNSVTITCRQFRLSVNNHLDRSRFFNSLTLQSPPVTWDRTVQVSLMVPWGDWYAMYNLGVGGVPLV